MSHFSQAVADSKSYQWPLDAALSASLKFDKRQVAFAITNTGKNARSIPTFWSDPKYLKDSVLRIQFSTGSPDKDEYPIYKLAPNGKIGTGSEFFTVKNVELPATQSVGNNFDLIEALKTISNPAITQQLTKKELVFRIVVSIDREILSIDQPGTLQFITPWQKIEN